MITGQWRTSTRSGDGGDCVEVRLASDGMIEVRDSKDRSKAPHRYTTREWSAFIGGTKDGEFDL